MPWNMKVHYGKPVVKSVDVEMEGWMSYPGAIEAADEAGERPPKCKLARAEYVSFSPAPGAYGSPEWETNQTRENKQPEQKAK